MFFKGNLIHEKPKINEKFKEEKLQEIEKLKVDIGKSDKINEKKDRKLFFLKKKYDKIRNTGILIDKFLEKNS